MKQHIPPSNKQKSIQNRHIAESDIKNIQPIRNKIDGSTAKMSKINKESHQRYRYVTYLTSSFLIHSRDESIRDAASSEKQLSPISTKLSAVFTVENVRHLSFQIT